MNRLPLALVALALASCAACTSNDHPSASDTQADSADATVTPDTASPDTASDDTPLDDSSMPDLADASISEIQDDADISTSETTGDISVSETNDTDTDAVSCLVDSKPGERIPVGDSCNFCVCQSDGSTVCTKRTCQNHEPACEYDGVTHPFAATFPATDGCNTCVCAASGLACTRRCAGLPEEGAILVESLDTPCGEDPTFTARSVLDEIPTTDISGPFAYNRNGPLYPESRADTTGRIRVVYEGGFIACRIPSADQPAFDIEVTVEWMTADGAFDEGMHTYLRKNGFGFVDAWLLVASWPHGGLHGAYDSTCLDPSGYSFSAQIDRDGTVSSGTFKTCETDIGLQVGTLTTTVPPVPTAD